MSDQTDKKDPNKNPEENILPPDPETLHKTDPQENMKGPISSFMHNVKEEAEKGDAESKAEADKKKDETT